MLRTKLQMRYSNCTSAAMTDCSNSSLPSLTIESDVSGTDSAPAVIEDEADPDLYGQIHTVENDELIQKSLHSFDALLAVVPDKKKHSVLQAQVKCPEILTDSFKLMFLRCECYNAELAVKRYIIYWDKRVEAFGSNAAFRPLTLSGTLSDDTVALELGAMHIIRRNNGRDILFFDTSKLDKTKYTRESGLRALWYFLHALLEDEDVQKRGMIVISFNRRFSSSNRDPQFTKLCASVGKGAIPIRLSAVHGCHIPLCYSFLMAFLLLFVDTRVRKRIFVHNGTDEQVLKLLENQYQISAEHVPTIMGGKLHLDIHAWLASRRASGQ